MTVVIFAQDCDAPVDQVIRRLTARDVPVFRADTSWFPQRLTIEARLESDRRVGCLATDHHRVDLDDIRSIWYRDPTAFDLPASLSQPERRFAFREARLGLGANGLPEHAPYDRIIATCSVPAVPWSWVEQTREEGLILADVTPAQLAGNLVLLRRTSGGAEGRFDRTYGSFMAMRRIGESYGSPRPGPTRDRGTARSRKSTLNATRPWEHPVLWFLAHFHLPPGVSFGLCGGDPSRPPTTMFLSAADGSWCEIDAPFPDGTSQVWEAGPHQLWRIIEEVHATWLDMGQPGWERFGLTVTPAQQWAWLDAPESDMRWDLSLAQTTITGSWASNTTKSSGSDVTT